MFFFFCFFFFFLLVLDESEMYIGFLRNAGECVDMRVYVYAHIYIGCPTAETFTKNHGSHTGKV